MTKVEAWYRRSFYKCFPIYKIDNLKIGDVFYRLRTQPIEYVYVGKGLLWIKFLCLIILLSSCSSSWHLKQAERHLKRAEIKGAQVRVDTVYKTISVIVPETRVDTFLTVQNFRDTITLEKDKIVTKIKFDTLTRRLYVQTVCPPDSVFIRVPVSVTKEIKSGLSWYWLLVAALAGAGLFTIINKHK